MVDKQNPSVMQMQMCFRYKYRWADKKSSFEFAHRNYVRSSTNFIRAREKIAADSFQRTTLRRSRGLCEYANVVDCVLLCRCNF